MKEILKIKIETIIDAIMKVAAGDYLIQVEVSEKLDYIDALSMGINMMVDDIRKSHEMEIENSRINFLNTQLQEALIKADESETRLIEAQRIAKVGNWFIDFRNGHLKWSKACYSILEIDENIENENLRPALRDKIHTDDLIQLEKINKQAIKDIEGYKFVYRALLKNGIKNILLISEPVLSSENIFIGTKGTIQDITEQKKAELELTKAKEKAQESDRLKSAFLAIMSHEIRTPMNGILGFTEILKEYDLTSEEKNQYIGIIEKSGARMLNIINDIIDISKIEAGMMHYEMSESNINEQIEYIYTFFKPEVEAKGMKLSFRNSLPAKEAIIKTDREKLYAIFTNLVKNAIKYTNEGSIEFGYHQVETIHELSLQPHQSSLQFYVKDTGIGIPKDRQAAIFERFIKADIADKMASQGAGLGLAITKAYVEMLGGKIWLESQEGIGSTFYFTLADNAEPVKETVIQQLEQLAPLDKTSHLRKLKILIAEDDEVSEMLINITVKMFSREILIVRTGVEAVEICRENPTIDLVLMDIQLPEMGGYEATQQIREFNKDVVIIAQTAYGLTGDREKAIESGCNDYISKPIKKDELLALIQKYFGK